MKNINYKSYDGNLYDVNKRGMNRTLAAEYLKRHGTNAPIPIIFIGCNINSEWWDFYEVEKTLDEKHAVPLIRIGMEERRCPFCNERKCIIERRLGSISFDTEDEKFSFRRHLCKCSNRKSDDYFIVEYRIDNEHFEAMLIKKQCPACRAYGKITTTEHQADLESKFTKDMTGNLDPVWRDRYLNTRLLEFYCQGCDLRYSLTIQITGKFYRNIKGVIDNPAC